MVIGHHRIPFFFFLKINLRKRVSLSLMLNLGKPTEGFSGKEKGKEDGSLVSIA